MKNKNELLKNYIPIAILGFLCLTSVGLTNVVGLRLTIIFSILYLFIENIRNKGKMEDIGFIPKKVLSDIKKYWWLILLPVVSGIVSIILFKFAMPEVYLYALNTKPMSFGKLFLQMPKLLILAFAEEIAFRGFLQTKLCNITKTIWAIIITSLFFAIVNFWAGSLSGLIYTSVFIFIDSIIYGVIFQKTKNIYSCTISHFLAYVIVPFILLYSYLI